MSKYLIIIEKAERNCCAWSPDLPGCVAAGKTVATTKRLMNEAVGLHIRGLKEDGLPVPRPRAVADYAIG